VAAWRPGSQSSRHGPGRVIQRAAELGNASRAFREAGISRALFDRWRKRLERYGADGVHPCRHTCGGAPASPPSRHSQMEYLR